ncbi:MAG TPA: nucleotidyltransferase family protein [Candidatus Paceibacterota bacterium]
MKTIILAAGYATRLYPLTLTKPKPLLQVAHKPMLERVLEKLALAKDDEVIIVTNEKFRGNFERFADSYKRIHGISLKVLNDGSSSDENKLGAIGDLHLAIEKENIAEDILVIAGDNLFSESLAPFREYAVRKNAPVLAVYDIGSIEATKKFNAISVNEESVITFFEEKPSRPQSSLMGIALYYYPKNIVPLIKTYIQEGNNADQPGRFIQWLYKKMPVYTWRVPGIWFDIGSKETLDEANQAFAEIALEKKGAHVPELEYEV